jgi:hypothetical protein
VHGKPTEVSATTFDRLLGIDLETLALEKGAGRQTGVSRHLCATGGAQR